MRRPRETSWPDYIWLVAFAGIAIAQQTGIKRTPLQKLDFPAGYNTVTAIAEVPAGGAAGRHTHPGAETGYVT